MRVPFWLAAVIKSDFSLPAGIEEVAVQKAQEGGEADFQETGAWGVAFLPPAHRNSLSVSMYMSEDNNQPYDCILDLLLWQPNWWTDYPHHHAAVSSW